MVLYPASIRKDGNVWLLLFPDFPQGGHTNGQTVDDALRHAPDALRTIISMRMERGLDIPMPGRPASRKTRLVALGSVIEDAKVELYMAVKRAGIRKAELARRMGIHKQQVERLLDLDHTSRIEQLEAAFAAVGKRLLVAVDNAA